MFTGYKSCTVFKVLVNHKIMVDVTGDKASVNLNAIFYLSEYRHQPCFYVLCEDALLPRNNLNAYTHKRQTEQDFSEAHTTSLIFSEREADLKNNETITRRKL